MKAITLHQPWATLIALGKKKFETRSWATVYRGSIAIHAGQKVDKESIDRLEKLYPDLFHEINLDYDEWPTGVIVATAKLTDCWEVSRCLRGDIVLEKDGGNTRREDPIGKQEEAFGWYDDGRVAWELDSISKLLIPVPVKGQQRLWNWSELSHVPT